MGSDNWRSQYGLGPATRQEDWYDTMQVCRNGHVISHYATSQPEAKQTFCADCGAPTVEACDACSEPIRGHHHMAGVFSFDEGPTPKHCIKCGAAYPWQRAAIENLSEILRSGGLSDQDVQDVESALPDILHDTPKTQSASLRLKRLLPKLGATVYDIAIKVVTDVASETAKKTMGLN